MVGDPAAQLTWIRPFCAAISAMGGAVMGVLEDMLNDPWYASAAGEGQPGQFKSMPKEDLTYGIKDVDEQEIKELIAHIRRRRQAVGELWNALLT
jgi:hypothetical protein